jgi:hypothetical protein
MERPVAANSSVGNGAEALTGAIQSFISIAALIERARHDSAADSPLAFFRLPARTRR